MTRLKKFDYEPTSEEIENLYERLKKEAAAGGYFLNPDEEFTKLLVRSILINEKRYGYWACPCRLAEGDKEKDMDIICPCIYRDEDINEYNACYCGLYVSKDAYEKKVPVRPIPERRPPEGQRRRSVEGDRSLPSKLTYPVWRCTVCGYLAARDNPPDVCPVCKARRERFERFL
ncbi:MAG: ferredoxin:glutaredoxin reductase [Deltaproteobacteria bacterium]|nr:ferredoxin:glutaredoxin reductase [Deltaproteobacteria bacterium]